MNNKGQSLVLFIIIIPIMLLLIFLVYDVGNMILLKQELNNINYIAIDYGIDHLNEPNIEENIHNIITKNKSNIDKIEINIEDNIIYIDLESKIKNKISIIKQINNFNIKSSYIGYLENNKKIIERNNR